MLTGKEAEKICDTILKNKCSNIDRYPEPFVIGYFPEKMGKFDVFTVFDNSTGDCWVEAFRLEIDAIAWCEGRIEADYFKD